MKTLNIIYSGTVFHPSRYVTKKGGFRFVSFKTELSIIYGERNPILTLWIPMEEKEGKYFTLGIDKVYLT